jgi:hypothetical protein
MVILAVCALANATAFADDKAAFVKAVTDPQEQAHVLDTAKKSTVVLNNPCPSAQYTLLPELSIYAPPTFDSAGGILTGAWKHTLEEEGCGVTRTLNVLVLVRATKSLAVMPLLPGTTHADPQLQRDAVRYAVAAVGGPEANCTIGYVADTTFIDHEASAQPGAKAPAWRELWTLTSCTRRSQVPMRFIPDATGTQIVADATGIKKLPLNASP